MRNYIQFLASDNLEGRNIGSPGFEKAAAYVAAEFAQASLKPAGTSRFLQPVEFTETSLNASRSSLKLVHAGQSQTIEVPAEAQLIYSPDSAPSTHAPIVFAGFGLVIPEAGHDDLRGLQRIRRCRRVRMRTARIPTI